jgi:5-methylcytosine-specific restriction protein A
VKVCAQPQCPELLESGRWCPEHRPKRRGEYRSPESQRRQKQYGKQRWREFSKAYLASHPKCVRCGAPSQHTDHIDGEGLDGPLGWDEAGLQALCASCHSYKTAIADGSFGRPRLTR